MENPVTLLQRLDEERKILQQTRWAFVHNYKNYDDVRHAFDTWAPLVFGTSYDIDLAKDPEAHLHFYRTVAPLLLPQSEILDVGCGTGLAGFRLINEGQVVDGIDISEQMLERSRRRGYRTTWKQNIVHGIETEGRVYDAMISVGVFGEYVPAALGLEKAMPHLRDRALVAFTSETTSTDIEHVLETLERERFIWHTPEIKEVFRRPKTTLFAQDYYYVTAVRM